MITLGLSLYAISFVMYVLHVQANAKNSDATYKHAYLRFARSEVFERIAFLVALVATFVLLSPLVFNKPAHRSV